MYVYCVYLLYKYTHMHAYCNGANETWGVRIHVQAFIKLRRGQNTGRVKHQLTDMLRIRTWFITHIFQKNILFLSIKYIYL